MKWLGLWLGGIVAFGGVGGRAELGTWNRFRGPNGSGVATDAHPPLRFCMEDLAWKTRVPSGLSSPVLDKKLAFLTAVQSNRLVTLAFEKTTGKLVWRREAPPVPLERVHRASSPAAPTPYVDEEAVYVYFGSYGLLCYDHAGHERWKRPIPTPKTLYGMATSPIGYGETLIQVLDNDANLPGSKLSRSRILAVRKSNGETVWETARPFHRCGWSTPMVWTHAQGRDLVVLGHGSVCGYNPDTGVLKWFATGFSRETIAVPVAGCGYVFLSSARLGGSGDERIDPEPFWRAVMLFDRNGDGKLERSEMTGHFTFPIRPELPPEHPGFGIPLPEDPAQRQKRLDGMFGWVDADRDGYWTREELAARIVARHDKPLLMAVRPGGRGDVTRTHVAWTLRQNIPEIPSPLFYKDRLYLVRDGGLFASVDARTGKILYRERLDAPGQYSASPVAAGGHIYVVSNRGVLTVLKAGDTFRKVHQLDLGERVFATPAIDANTIYIRTDNHLLAFRQGG